jgi:hypothetical protein
VKDENGDLLLGPYNFLNRWKNYTSQLLNVYRASDQADRNKYSTGISTRS